MLMEPVSAMTCEAVHEDQRARVGSRGPELVVGHVYVPDANRLVFLGSAIQHGVAV
jgi:hypothetical protein